MSSCRTLEDMIARAWEQEIDWELMEKQKSVQTQEAEGSTKRPKIYDSRVGDQQGRTFMASTGNRR